ncbi:uncharacterized protein LOC117180520 [Belonocnema kinseyi]|uniref:uncharacterized protein LOC117180520 n=1 Tax=Belonocnema kinseyi TaxID=2817044 RepID=UPI00143DDA38|nr:uncharacterized protein LOC117180520 [Belonocnema kinseyi]
MSTMEALGIELVSLHEAIMRTEINFKKLACDKRNETTIRGRLEWLKEKWHRCLELDLKARALYTLEEKKTIGYFSESQFLQIEEASLAALDYLNSNMHTFVSNVAVEAKQPTQENVNQQNYTIPKLPKITLPEFSGNYVDWENFRDLFEALIVNNMSLSNVSRLHYLKSLLVGDASHVIKHVTVTDANFTTFWETIKIRYDNKRALINAHLQAIATIPNVSNNSVVELRVLRDSTNEAFTCLKNLNRPTQHWDDFMVFWIVRKLDMSSLKEWEMHLGSETDYPTFKKLDDFLATRVRTLEAIQLSKGNLPEKGKINKGQSVKGHNAFTISKCLMCQENHHLFKCKQFRELSIDQRKELVLRHHCCLNCLTPGHKPYNCSSKYTCRKCHRKHNTLLHIEFKSNSNSIATMPVLTSANTLAISSPVAGTSNTGLVINEISDSPPLKIQGAHHTNLNDATVYFWNNKCDLSRSTLLATAVVNIRADNGRVNACRVLLDQGSECCFLSERLVKILNPKYQRVNALVYGVGGDMMGAAKKLAQVVLLPKRGVIEPVFMQALVLLHLTSYTPPVRPGGGVEKELKELSLADPDPFGSEAIDMILGAYIFGSCLLPWLK